LSHWQNKNKQNGV